MEEVQSLSAMARKQRDVHALLEAYSEPVENFFASALGRDFQCFGCSEHNSAALGIEVLAPSKPQECPSVLARIPAVGQGRSSFPGIVHGGVLSAIADDVAYWTIFGSYHVLALTVSLNMRFMSPAPSEGALLALGTVKSSPSSPGGKAGMYEVAVEIFSASTGTIHATGSVSFYAAPDSQLQAVFGKDVFSRLRERL